MQVKRYKLLRDGRCDSTATLVCNFVASSRRRRDRGLREAYSLDARGQSGNDELCISERHTHGWLRLELSVTLSQIRAA